MNILIIILLFFASIGIVKMYEHFKKTLRYVRLKKVRAVVNYKEGKTLRDAVDNWNHSYGAILIDEESPFEVTKEELQKNWNSFTGFESEQDQVNETLRRC